MQRVVGMRSERKEPSQGLIFPSERNPLAGLRTVVLNNPPYLLKDHPGCCFVTGWEGQRSE